MLRLNNDTVTVISMNQAKKINLVFNDFFKLKKENNILNKSLNDYFKLGKEKDSLNNEQTIKFKNAISKITKLNNDLNISCNKYKKGRKYILGVGLIIGVLISLIIVK